MRVFTPQITLHRHSLPITVFLVGERKRRRKLYTIASRPDQNRAKIGAKTVGIFIVTFNRLIESGYVVIWILTLSPPQGTISLGGGLYLRN